MVGYIAERPLGNQFTKAPLDGTKEKRLILGKSYLGYRYDESSFHHRVHLIFGEAEVTMYYKEKGMMMCEAVDFATITVCVPWFTSPRKVRRES